MVSATINNIKKENCYQEDYSIIISPEEYENYEYYEVNEEYTIYYFKDIELNYNYEKNQYSYLGNKLKEMVKKYKDKR